MKYYWKNGFYIEAINCESQPEGAVEISKEDYRTLLGGQKVGKRIITNESGYPELADYKTLPPNPVAEANTLLHTIQVRTAAMTIPLSDEKLAYKLSPICPTWTAGQHYYALEIINHEGIPYRVIQEVDALSHQPPGSDGMLAIYRPVDPATGSSDDPKTFYYGMDVENGLYYTYEGTLYMAKADMPACVYYPGSDGVWQWEQVIDASEKLSDVVL